MHPCRSCLECPWPTAASTETTLGSKVGRCGSGVFVLEGRYVISVLVLEGKNVIVVPRALRVLPTQWTGVLCGYRRSTRYKERVDRWSRHDYFTFDIVKHVHGRRESMRTCSALSEERNGLLSCCITYLANFAC